MRKSLALVLTICIGALAVGCEPEKPAAPKPPQADLGKAAPPPAASTTPPAKTPEGK